MKEAVSALPDKLDTIIEDGGSLSRGQVKLPSKPETFGPINDLLFVYRNNSYV